MTAQQLKNSILQMAVQGKLVPQDPNDEPASVLLERIKAEKQELIKAGKIKKDKKSSEIFRGASRNLPYAFCEQIGKEIRDISDEIPFEIPDSWEWCRLSDITNKEIKRGKSPVYADKGAVLVFAQKCNVKGGGINLALAKYLSGSVVSKYPQEEFMLDCDIIVNSTGDGTLGRIGYYSDSDNPGRMPLVPDSHVTIVRVDKNYSKYVYNVLRWYQPLLEKCGEGSTKQTELKADRIKELLFPLPPISEQHRIVAKIEELLPYIERYGKAEEHLTALNTTFPEALKKSILQEAVQGKLVPQDPDDEPASVLLERIRAEKQALIKAGKIKKDKHESVIVTRDKVPYEIIDGKERCIADEVPFEIPDNWCWCRLGDILLKLTDGTHSTPKYTESGIPFISVKDVSSGSLDFSNCKHISEKEHSELYERCNPEYGDILLTKVGTTGIPVIVDTTEQFSLFVSVALLKFNQELLYNKYLIHMINSPLVQKQATENTKGVGNKNWVMRDIANTLIVIPPIEEQHRIVSKIEEIIPIVNTITK